jgi:hypothetical protein
MSNSQFAPTQHGGFLPFSSVLRAVPTNAAGNTSLIPVDVPDFMGSIVLTVHHDHCAVKNKPGLTYLTIRKCPNSTIHSIRSISLCGTGIGLAGPGSGNNTLTGSIIESVIQFCRNFDAHQASAILGNSQESQEYSTYLPASSSTIEIPWIMSANYPLPISRCPADLAVKIEPAKIMDILLLRSKGRQVDFNNKKQIDRYTKRISCPSGITIECHAVFSKVPALLNYPETNEKYKRRSCFQVFESRSEPGEPGKDYVHTVNLEQDGAGPLIGVMWRLEASYPQASQSKKKPSYHDFNTKGNYSTNPLEDGRADPIMSTTLRLDNEQIVLPGSLSNQSFDPEMRQPLQTGIHIYTTGVNPFLCHDIEGKRVKSLTVTVTPCYIPGPPSDEQEGSDSEDQILSDEEFSVATSVKISEPDDCEPSGYVLVVMPICVQTIDLTPKGVNIYNVEASGADELIKEIEKAQRLRQAANKPETTRP